MRGRLAGLALVGLAWCAVVLGGCAGGHDARELAAWRQSIEQRPATDPMRRAWEKDPVALESFFAKALHRLDRPFILAGEDVEALDGELHLLLQRWGDESFAAVLQRQPARIRAAVANFLQPASPSLGAYPKTRALLASAPRVKFAARRS